MSIYPPLEADQPQSDAANELAGPPTPEAAARPVGPRLHEPQRTLWPEDADGRLIPSDELLADLAESSRLLENAEPREIIEFAVQRYFPRLAMATAFGPEGCVIIHYLAQIEPRTYVFNMDTGYQFAETLALRDQLAKRYGVEVEMRRPATSVEEYERINGGPVYKTDPDRCCRERKIQVLHESVAGMHAWMSGIRRDQSTDRARASIVGWDKKFRLVKISPLANWTKKEVWKLITDEQIPYNPLHDQGYTSIGCWPCTRAVMFGEDERAGRWSGSAKKECGLHTAD